MRFVQSLAGNVRRQAAAWCAALSFSRLLVGARKGQPQSLEDLLRGYDVTKVKSLTRDFLDTPAVGKERL
ncbi:MAG TPA: hypothetical protein VKI44_15230 [Acetobacteraceae bacterium]|nr:hypothetical protein [Acetobacteraceae bacterium]